MVLVVLSLQHLREFHYLLLDLVVLRILLVLGFLVVRLVLAFLLVHLVLQHQ